MKKLVAISMSMFLVLSNFQGWNYLGDLELFNKWGLFQGIENTFALEEGVTDNGLEYTKNNGEVVITGYSGSDEVLVILSEIDGGKEVMGLLKEIVR